jgi:hypothetical protein
MSKDRITVQIGDVRHTATKPHEEAEYCVVDIACPHCKVTPLKVSGHGKSIDPDARHDTWRADGSSVCCNVQIGTIRVKVSTLFGIEEDQRVYSMGIRIY